MSMRTALAITLCFTALLASCGGGPRPVARIADDIRRTAPPGWTITTSGAAIHIQSIRKVSLIGRISRPAFLSMEELARDFGYTTNYHVTLSFVPRLSTAEHEHLREARRPFQRVLDTGARSKSEYGDAQRGYQQHRVPLFYTDDYSIFVDRPMDRFIEVYPQNAATEVQALMASLNKVFREY